MTYPRDITTEVEAAVLEHADRLAAIIGKHWHPANDTDRDDVHTPTQGSRCSPGGQHSTSSWITLPQRQ